MCMQFTLVLVASLLLGTNANQAAKPDAKLQQVAKATVVSLENATITISPEVKISLRPVKTAQGVRLTS